MKLSRKLSVSGTILIVIGLLFLTYRANKNFYNYIVNKIAQNNYEFTANLNTQSRITHDFTMNFPFTKFFIDLNGEIRNILNQVEMNGVIKQTNGYLTTLNRMLSDEEIEIRANRLKKISDFCKENGISFLLLQPSYDISKFDPQLPSGKVDYTNSNIDRLLNALTTRNVPFIDLREEMNKDGIDVYDYYYRTDHHWNLRGGFYAFQKIVQWISKERNVPYDELTTNINNYQILLYKNWHMGSRAQQTGAKFAGAADDYELFYPKFPARILNKSENKIQTFYDSLINKELFAHKPKNTNRYTYDSAYERTDINKLESLDAKTPLSVLFIGDSYSRAVKQFLLVTYKHAYVGLNGFNSELIEKYKPDVIILETYPSNLNAPNIYTFN